MFSPKSGLEADLREGGFLEKGSKTPISVLRKTPEVKFVARVEAAAPLG